LNKLGITGKQHKTQEKQKKLKLKELLKKKNVSV
jgi:hypothetical protein